MEVDSAPVLSIESRKRKRSAKNRKKYWKKQCSVHDVEEFLNDQRLQAKSGGPISEKPDEKLFMVDSKSKNKSKTATQRRKERIARARCYESLEPNPDIDAVSVRRTQPLTVGSLKYARRKKVETRRLRRLKQIQADVQRVEVLKDRRARREQAEKQRVEGATTNHYYGLWQEPDTGPPMKEEEFIEHTKPKPIKPPGHYYFKPSRLSAIELPPPGTSYNPSYDDHQTLLRHLHEIEEKRVKGETKASKQPFVKKISREEFERNWLEEMSVGLFDEKTPAVQDGVDKEAMPKKEVSLDDMPNNHVPRRDIPAAPHSDALHLLSTDTPRIDVSSDEDHIPLGSLSSTAVATIKPLKRRTKAARRHELIEKKRIERLKKAKKLKLLSNDVYKLKSIKNSITMKEQTHNEKLKRRLAIRRGRLNDPKRLGPHKYKPPEQDVKLLSELEGSLRLLKPEGDILYDRFKSFQKRNILRATVKAKVTKAKKKNRPKRVEKREVKAVTL